MLWAVFEIAPYKRYVFCGQSRKMIKINGASDLYNLQCTLMCAITKIVIRLKNAYVKEDPNINFPLQN